MPSLRAFAVAGRDVRINEDTDAGLSFVVWPAAAWLVDYLQTNHERLVAGKRVLELGAGYAQHPWIMRRDFRAAAQPRGCRCGLVSIAASLLSATDVTATDQAGCLEHLAHNVQLNCPSPSASAPNERHLRVECPTIGLLPPVAGERARTPSDLRSSRPR